MNEGVWVLREAINGDIHFALLEVTSGPAFFAHVIAETGRYLSPLSGVPVGAPLAYLIAPPTEAMLSLDAALEAVKVTLATFFGLPTETNFADAVVSVAQRPLSGLVCPERDLL